VKHKSISDFDQNAWLFHSINQLIVETEINKSIENNATISFELQLEKKDKEP